MTLTSSNSKFIIIQKIKIFLRKREKKLITHISDRMIFQYFQQI